MARRVGLGQDAARTLADRAPRLLVIAGATGTGKSTASVQLAADSGFARLLSTDAIREIMRACDEDRTQSNLHRSSFSRGTQGSLSSTGLTPAKRLSEVLLQPLTGPEGKALIC